MLKASTWAIGIITATASALMAAPADRIVDLPAKSIKGLKISGYRGNVYFTAGDADTGAKSKANPNVTVDANSKTDDPVWRPVVENVDGWVHITIHGPSAKSDWRAIQLPSVDLDVRGPSVPIVVTWKEGDFFIRNWKATANITHHQGKVVSEGGQAPMKVTSLEGEVAVHSHTGRLSLDNYNARVALKQIEGGMSLENFSGNLTVEGSKGEISLKTAKGRSQINGHKGGLDFDLAQGEIIIAGLEGPIRGQGDQGQVTAELKGIADFKVRAESTKVAVLVPKSSGANVNLGTTDGTFSVSFPLKTDKVEKFRLQKGSLPGKDRGNIFVRTKGGDIRLRPIR